jgi:hypothetical protein
MLIAQEYTLQTPLVGSPCRDSGSSGFPRAGYVHDSSTTPSTTRLVCYKAAIELYVQWAAQWASIILTTPNSTSL